MDETVLTKTKDTLIHQLHARILKNATERVKNIDAQIIHLLESNVHSMVAAACGFRDGTFNGWELHSHPEKYPIGRMLVDKAEKAATKFFKENMGTISFESFFSAKEKNAIAKQLKEEYKNTFMQVIGKLAETKANEDARRDAEGLLDQVLEEAIESVPAAPVGKEPPLPRCISKVVAAKTYKLLLKALIRREMWFQVDPMPGGKFEVYVKDEEGAWLEDELEEISQETAGK